MISAVVAQEDVPLEQSERVLRMGFLQDVDNMNPNLGQNDASYVFYGLVYDNPQCIDDNLSVVGNLVLDSRPVPLTDPEMIDTDRPYGSIWEYNITLNAMWHDGEPFTIDDFVWNMNIQCDNLTYTSMWAFQPFTYFTEYAKEIDEDTARVYFYDRATGEPKASSYAYELGIPMLPKHKLEKETNDYIASNWDGTFNDTTPPIVGTGPFKASSTILSDWRAGNSLTFIRNEDYHWGPEFNMYVQFDQVVMRFYDDASAMSLALQSGDLDIAQFPPDTYKAIKDKVESRDRDFRHIETYDGPKITGYWTEIEVCMGEGGPNPCRLDPAVRHALAMATNKTHIVQNYYQGLADEGSTVIAPIYTDWHYEPTADEKWDFDLEAAAKVLDDAGYRYPTPGASLRVATSDSWAVKTGRVPLDKPLEFQMLIRTEYPEEKLIAGYLDSVWSQIGIGLDWENNVMAESLMSKKVYGYLYDTCIWYWSSDVDPNYQLYVQTSLAWGGWSDNRYYNASYEQNYMDSVSAMDYATRKVYVDACQRIHYLDASWIIMANVHQTYAWRTDSFTGWGDWSLTPGRSLDNFWTGNPLFFVLEYTGGGGGGFDWQTAAIAGGVVAAIAAVIVVYVWRKRKKGETIKESPLGQ
jgi:peptide/nickel transport system substrate-binding protein